MSRQLLTIEAHHFTTISALAREVEALLEHSDYKLEVIVGASDFEELTVELDGRRTMGRVAVRSPKETVSGRVKAVSTHRFEIIDDTYKKWPDGRLEALKTRKGREWYQDQVEIMATRQGWVCGLLEYGKCVRPDFLMHSGATSTSDYLATFEHWNKRGAGKRNDSIDPKTKNCAVHSICNGELGSRRIQTD